MASLAQNLQLLASQNQFLVYFIFYFAVVFLGNIAGFTALWLALEGIFGPKGFLITICVLIAADISGDLLWYALGLALRDTRFGKWAIKRIPYHNRIEAHLHRNARRWIFLSKFIYASTFPIIFSAGWVKISFKKFFRMSLLSIFLWTPLLTLITYGIFLGVTPLRTQPTFRHFEYLVAIGVIVFLLLDALISGAVKRLFTEKDEVAGGV